MPTDPGVQGSASVEGVDSNGNQVRDDVEIALGLADLSQRERGAAFLVSRAMEAGIRISGTSGNTDERRRRGRLSGGDNMPPFGDRDRVL